MNEGGLNPDVPKGAEWRVVTGEELFHFPTPEEEAAALKARVRARRDGLLASSDWTQTVADSPLSDKVKAAWAKYRQKLRDLPEQPGFPEAVEWPVAPGA
ncbi:MAG: phage tail assembly chaperone [Spirochaetes bacterium]|nr:phage tail assembly chaperone [Spirochaetota bacterium]